MVVFLNKCGSWLTIEELIELVEMELRELLEQVRVSRATTFLSCRVRRCKALENPEDEGDEVEVHLGADGSSWTAIFPQPERDVEPSRF